MTIDHASTDVPAGRHPYPSDEQISLCETLDRVLNKGAVLVGDVVISVAGVELIYVGLQVVLTSMETARGDRPAPPATEPTPEPRA